ncbi:Glycoside hydrolase family 16 [Macrophomina phaseolina MS6]|uniref:chitinase n=1 Tax=Macrophomina phaseolina (strain MS6) TaxID=1126212 RepID=K2RAX1_MACPH|nr:Glycoside hydrolase family 16 [Macrophomina phaseolina MS6]
MSLTLVASCPPDKALSSSSYSVDFTQGKSDDWTVTAGSVSYDSNGAAFTIKESGDAPTIETSFYFLFGQVEILLRSAPGTGIVSSVVLESDDLDEIDWEWLGGNSAQVESNYFGKGNTTSYDRAVYHAVSPDTQNNVHNYTILWTSEYTTWFIDSVAVRTLNYADAVGGSNYPQTPMRLKIGIWAGGDSSNDQGTIGWAGGTTDYSDGPFTFYVQSVSIVNYSPATSYSYSDTTGSWRSIDVEGGEANSNEGGVATSTSGTAASTTTRSGMWWTASANAVKAASRASLDNEVGTWQFLLVTLGLFVCLAVT